MFEVIWDTAPFNDKAEWTTDAPQPFVLSVDDRSVFSHHDRRLSVFGNVANTRVTCSKGYSQHGDYVFGWKGDALQRAMDASCFGASCSALKTQSFTDANKCSVQVAVPEAVDGCKYSPVL